MTWQILLARARFPLIAVGLALLFIGGRLGIPWLLLLILFLALLFVVMRAGTVGGDAIVVKPPISGRWLVLNSPATRVPSHGVQGYGQSYAIDLVHEPADQSRPRFGWWPLARRPTGFPGLGQPVLSAADGVVVRVHKRERDHWSRNSWPAMLYVIVEGMVRELTGPGRVLGNHVIVDLGDGTYAAYAHLQRGSLRVTTGQQITAGEHIADCGNSGSSTEPHQHFQLMDHPKVLLAAGLPISFDHYEMQGESKTGLPANNETFDAPQPASVLAGPTGKGV